MAQKEGAPSIVDTQFEAIHGAPIVNPAAPSFAAEIGKQATRDAEARLQNKTREHFQKRAQLLKNRDSAVGRAADVIPLKVRPMAQKITGAQSAKLKAKTPKTKELLTVRHRAQSNQGADAETLKSWLKDALPGWWDVIENGKGFVISFRWRAPGTNPKFPFPRLSRREFNSLKEMNSDVRKNRLYDRIAGHLEDLSIDPGRRDRARVVAERLRINLGSNLNVAGGNHAG